MPDPSIKNPNYREWEERDYTVENQYKTNLDQFEKTGKLLYAPTKVMYQTIRDYCIDFVKNHPQYPKFNWKPKIADIGCGGGFGSYILSHEADFVWGIDKSEKSIRFAREAFEKHKNGIYYSSQLTFDLVDIANFTREIGMPFDVVVCIEVIEHIADYNATLTFLKNLCKKNKKGEYLEPPDSTKVFISSPNRNYPHTGQDNPKNKKHVREWTTYELLDILKKHFKHIYLMDIHGNPKDLDMQDPIMLWQCETPIV